VKVSANLMHHAFEFLLKAGLIRAGAVPAAGGSRAVDDFLKLRYGHHLKTTWRDFKGAHRRHDFTRFDRAIKQLDKWEEIRYPRNDAAMTLDFAVPTGPGMANTGGMKTTYTLKRFGARRVFPRGTVADFHKAELKKPASMLRPLGQAAYETWNSHSWPSSP
jgi:hypothetical protein